MTPTVGDAARRALVHLDDDRTGTLLSIPAPSSHRSAGARARVILPSGAVVSVPVDQIMWIYPAEVTP